MIEYTTEIDPSGQYVTVKNSGNVAVCGINLGAGGVAAESAVVIGTSELAVKVRDGRTLIYDLSGTFLREA